MRNAHCSEQGPDEDLTGADTARIEWRRVLDLETKIAGQVHRYASEARLTRTAQRKQLRTLRLFSEKLREVSYVDAIDNEARRASLTRNLRFLLEVSNDAGALAGDLIDEKRKRSGAAAREEKAKKDRKRLRGLYTDLHTDIEPFLSEHEYGGENEIFKKLHKMDSKRYPESGLRTTVRYIADILESLRLSPFLRHKTREVLYAEFAAHWLDKEQEKSGDAIFEELRRKRPANYPESQKGEIDELVAGQEKIDAMYARIVAKLNAAVARDDTCGKEPAL